MPINVQAPDGSIAQFPDGMADADIEKVMAAHYPQPSVMDRIAASPVGRFLHDTVAAPIQAITNGPLSAGFALGNMIPGQGHTIAGTVADAKPQINPSDAMGTEAAFQGALARNRNTPGYLAARAIADKSIPLDSSGLTDQLVAPFLPATAGAAGMFGGLDSSNAMADAQQASQAGYADRHPVLSFGANLVGGALTGRPDAPLSVPAMPPVSTIAGKPTEAAALYLQRLGADPAKLAAAQAAAGSKPITTAEAIGKPAEVALGALARRPGDTGDAFGALLQTRNEAMPGRILGDYAAASGINPLAARGDIEGFIDANQKAAGPLYDEAYKANQNISSPMLDRILATPAGKQALASARTKMQNDMSLMGTPDADLMDQAREGETPIPANGVASGMKLRVYDYVKRSLDDQIGSAFRAGNKNEGNILVDLKGKLVSALDNADVTAAAGPNSVKPEGGLYAQARAKAGEYLSAKKQFEAGGDDILDNGLPVKDFAAVYSKLGPADQQAYLGGVANKMFNLQQSGKLKADVFKSPLVQGKLAAVMGPDKAAKFLTNMGTEKQMAEFARTQAPRAGSGTAGWQAAMQDQDGNSALAAHAVQLSHDAMQHGIIPAVTNAALGKLRDAAATYVTRGMGIPVRDAAGQLLMQPPSATASFLQNLPQIIPPGPLQRPVLPNNSVFPYGIINALPQLSPSVPQGR